MRGLPGGSSWPLTGDEKRMLGEGEEGEISTGRRLVLPRTPPELPVKPEATERRRGQVEIVSSLTGRSGEGQPEVNGPPSSEMGRGGTLVFMPQSYLIQLHLRPAGGVTL